MNQDDPGQGIAEGTELAGLESEGLHPVQIEIFRTMTPARKIELAMKLYWSARRLKAAGLRLQHPDCPRRRFRPRSGRYSCMLEPELPAVFTEPFGRLG